MPTEDVGDRVEQAVPAAESVVAPELETTESVCDEWPAQLLMVDQRATIASGIEEGGLPDVNRQVAMWTYGNDHGVAAWMRELLDDRSEGRGAGI